jgi:DNA repair protein RecN (Recombination protein N)
LGKRNKIVNLEKIISALRDAISVFNEEGGVSDGLRIAGRALSGILRLDENYENAYNKIEALAMEVDDIAAILSDMGDELYFDENEAAEVEARLDAIRYLKRKYGANKAEIDAYFEKINEEYNLLSDCDAQYASLTRKLGKTNDAIFDICQKITVLRKTVGERFCKQVVEELKTLNIPHAQFAIQFKEYTKEEVFTANAQGMDEICFLFSANAGEPMKTLGKIISGGEMSRFMLAIKTCLSSVNEISTYIFDEIDAGISGQTAKVVGEKLAKIAKNTQILAVSHLAQVAVMSDSEFFIEKQEKDGKTLTKVLLLSDEERKTEIVRLLGGDGQNEYAEKHAEEMLKQAEQFKNSLN